MFLIIVIIISCLYKSSAFCHMNEANDVQKYMMLYGKPTSIILINNMIDKYSKRTGISQSKIKSCINMKKAEINKKTKNLRRRS